MLPHKILFNPCWLLLSCQEIKLQLPLSFMEGL
jgi:hypothetical protein